MRKQIVGSIPVLLVAAGFLPDDVRSGVRAPARTPAPHPALRIFPAFGFRSGGNVFDLPRDAAAHAAWRPRRNSIPRGTATGPMWSSDFAENTDPFIKNCDPLGVPRVLLANHPFKIVPAAGEMLILYERSHDFREIYMDGRQHPKDLDPSWWGHSIGHWDGRRSGHRHGRAE